MKNYGVIIEEPKPEDYILGEVSPLENKVIFPDGHGWGDYLPTPEPQFNDGLETMSCVSQSANNCLEILWKCFFNIERNNSDRFTAKLSGTTKSGNSQNNVAESLRKIDGFVDEATWPFSKTITDWDTFYSSIPGIVKDKGKKNLESWEIKHEWVRYTKENFKNALKYAPIQAIGYAWSKDDNGIYHDYGNNPNHAFVIFDYVDGEYWLAFDSYPTDYNDDNVLEQEYIKKLDWNFYFGFAKQYKIYPILKKNETLWQKLSRLLLKIVFNFTSMLKYLYRDKNTGAYYFVKKVNNVPKKEKLTDENGVKMIMTILAENFGAKQTDWGELSKYQNYEFFGSKAGGSEPPPVPSL